MKDYSTLETCLKNIFEAHNRVLDVDRMSNIIGVYRNEAEYLIAARGANQALDEVVAEAKKVYYEWLMAAK